VQLFWICVGGAIGSGARFLLSMWMLERFGPGFPYGTLTVNVVGSFLLGLVMYLGLEAGLLSPTLRLALAVGVMGGFTTFSSFTFETMRLAQDGLLPLALLYVGLSVIACIAACLLGWGLAHWLAAPSL
jgi:CrcB protein